MMSSNTLSPFSALLILAISPGILHAENLIFNGSFELGQVGWAIERGLDREFNPNLKFTPTGFDAGAPGSGKKALLLQTPLRDYHLKAYAREVFLKANTRYTITFQVRASVPNRVLGVSMVSDWIKKEPRFTKKQYFKLSSEWKRYQWSFSSGKHNTYYTLSFDFGNQNTPADFRLDDVRLIEENDTSPDRELEIALVPLARLYEFDAKAKAEILLKAVNCSNRKVQKRIKIEGIDEYFKRPLFQRTISVDLNPGESAEFPFQEKITRLGSVRLNVSEPSDSIRWHPGFYTVIRRLDAFPVDLKKDYAVGLNTTTEHYSRKPGADRYGFLYAYNQDYEKRYELLERMGCRFFKDHKVLQWVWTEPEQGKFDFTYLEFMNQMYNRHQIQMIPCAGEGLVQKYGNLSLPDWVIQKQIPQPVAPKTAHSSNHPYCRLFPAEDFGIFLEKVAKHFKERIPGYEIINEGNLFLSPEEYMSYLKAAYEGIKKGCPEARVWGICASSDFGTDPSGWFQSVLRLGAGKYMDGFSFHPYISVELASPFSADEEIARLRQLLVDSGCGKDIPMFNSEAYYLQSIHHVTLQTLEGKTIAGDAAYCVEAHHVVWRFLVDLGEGVNLSAPMVDFQLWKRLLRPHSLGRPLEMIPSELFAVYNTLAYYFTAARPVTKHKYDGGGICYVFRDRNNKLIAGIWNWQYRSDVSCDLRDFKVYDLFGNPIPSGILKIGKTPYYLMQGSLREGEFLEKLKNLAMHRRDSIFPSPLIRFHGEKAIFGLFNDSSRPQNVTVGLQGTGISGKETVDLTLEPRKSTTVALPLLPFEKNAKFDSCVIQIFHDGRKKDIPVRSHVRSESRKSGETYLFHTREPEKLSGQWSLTLEKECMVFKASIQDGTDAGQIAERQLWQTDSIELFFDLAPLEMPRKYPNRYNKNCFRVFLLPREKKTEQVVVWSSNFQASDFSCEITRKASGYDVSLRIPVSAATVGFAAKVNDSEGERKLPVRRMDTEQELQIHELRCALSIIQ